MMSLTALSWLVGGLDQRGADVVPEAEVATSCLGLAGAGPCSSLLFLGSGAAQFVVVQACAGEVGLLASHNAVTVVELLGEPGRA